MSNYVYGTSLSYRDYLQAASFESALTETIATSSREIIVSLDEMQEQTANLYSGLTEQLADGFESIGVQLSGLTSSVKGLRAEMHWGFSEMILGIGQTKDLLATLVGLTRTPARTWATEQFESASDAVRRNLYRDGLEIIDRAINGYGSNLGYKLDHRFHYLRGVILLGSYENHDQSVVSPERAERAFLEAHRYAVHDSPNAAARSLMCAGWAAYVQGASDRALLHTESAIRLDGELAEGHFQLAKCLMHIREPSRALIPLQRACELDRRYTLKAAADGDFRPFLRETDELVSTLRAEALARAVSTIEQAEAGISRTASIECAGYQLADLVSLGAAEQAVIAARALASRGTLFDAQDALPVCSPVDSLLAKARSEFRTAALSRAEKASYNQKASLVTAQEKLNRDSPIPGYWLVCAIVGFFVALPITGTVLSHRDQVKKQEIVNQWSSELRARGYSRTDTIKWDRAAQILGHSSAEIPRGSPDEDWYLMILEIIGGAAAFGYGMGLLKREIRVRVARTLVSREEVEWQRAAAKVAQLTAYSP